LAKKRDVIYGSWKLERGGTSFPPFPRLFKMDLDNPGRPTFKLRNLKKLKNLKNLKNIKN